MARDVTERYTLEHKLGEGTSASVYRAVDQRLHRAVALKLLERDTAGDDQRRRFMREARALARLRHPNVAEVYDVGSTDEIDYLAMELVEGRALSEILADEIPLVGQYLGWLRDVADGLQAVHDAGLVHRDVKPANVRITPERESAILVDFGLAFAPGAEKGELARFTRGEIMLGTPCYLAPEKIRGKPADGKADVYALGCMAYEVVSGSPPFLGELSEIFAKHLHLPPLPLEQSSERPVVPEVAELVASMLAKSPDQRPTAGQVGALLRSIIDDLEQRPIAERPTLAPLPKVEAAIPRSDTAQLAVYCSEPLPEDGILALAMNGITVVDSEDDAEVAFVGRSWRSGQGPTGLPSVAAIEGDEVELLPSLVRLGIADALVVPYEWLDLVRKLKRVARRKTDRS